jgi:hypothetical protein
VAISSVTLNLVAQCARILRSGGDTRPYFDRLTEELLQNSGDSISALDVTELLNTDRLSGQVLIRHLRELRAYQFEENLNLEQLFFAIPLVITIPVEGPPDAWALTSVLLTQWMASNSDIDGHSVMSEAPILEGGGSDDGLQPADSFFNCGTHVDRIVKESENALGTLRHVAAIWPGIFRGTPAALALVQAKLRKMQQIAPEFMALKKRAEAAMLEMNVVATLFPPASWANAWSLARIARFRLQLLTDVRANPLKKEWTFSFQDGALTEAQQGALLDWGSFYEETKEDMLALLASAARSHNVKLMLL